MGSETAVETIMKAKHIDRACLDSQPPVSQTVAPPDYKLKILPATHPRVGAVIETIENTILTTDWGYIRTVSI